ncbi:30S ribosomal protein S14 [Rickettsia endosymbiont of Cardiosporidium cionae]|uniref:30S ribosomal protein S14 n=1 Tax=Rickettsia endosymbiont of Cardiosporidium cionae TaxID=2777155 RepID=UPI001893BB1E|nr:30S ribosomal protein S14 [Rickettsia endosymbiont of Cardiosporidium cionae]KAF8818189.1 30S ribosomal protein S14 [Rickettsia endosymbiont of Cardiosporidium cionae]
MSKIALINRNIKRQKMCDAFYNKRKILKDIISLKSGDLNERFSAVVKLSKLPRNSSKVRIRNRCNITGRPRGCYRKFALSRNLVREYAAQGLLPGVIKSSW